MYDEQGIKSRIEAATVHQLTLTEEEKRYLTFLCEYANTDTTYLRRYEGKRNEYPAARRAWIKREHPEGWLKSGYQAYALRGMEYLLLRTGYLILTNEDGLPIKVEWDSASDGALYTVVMPEESPCRVESALG